MAVGKYISLSDVGECSYSIIMATEIIGLSHMEREIVANVVKYNTMPFGYYDEMEFQTWKERVSDRGQTDCHAAHCQRYGPQPQTEIPECAGGIKRR